MEDKNNAAAVFKMLGELSADMKHVLHSLDSNKNDTVELRNEMREDNKLLRARLDKVEKFNVKVLTYASIAAPILVSAVTIGSRYLIG